MCRFFGRQREQMSLAPRRPTSKKRWPYMIPFTVIVAEAAAPQSTLAFMFWG
jgi:hypothetical protein